MYKNYLYAKEPSTYNDERIFSRADFVRVGDNTDIAVLDEFYYRFPKTYEILDGNKILNIDETYLRSNKKSTLSMEVLEHYFKDGSIEVFLKTTKG